MKTLKEFLNQETEKTYNNLDPSLNERYASAAVISARLSSWKNQVAREEDTQKQLAIIARMIHFGIGTIALVIKDSKRR